MIVIQNPGGGGLFGALVLWHGVASALPDGWAVYAPAQGVYLMGADLATITETPAGSMEHEHSNQNTNTVPNHGHTASVRTVSNASATVSTGFSSSGSSIADDHTHNSKSASITSAGAHYHETENTESADSTPPSKKLYWIRWVSGDVIPDGVITMWSEPAASIPADWYVCDGLNDTIDLRGEFILGAVEDADVGEAVGSETHIHGNGATAPDGEHAHPFSASMSNPSNTSNAGFPAGLYTVANGSHGHSASGNTDTEPDHIHEIVDTNAASSIPPCILVYFIEKRSA